MQTKIISKWFYLKFIASYIQQGTNKSFVPMFTTLNEYLEMNESIQTLMNIVCWNEEFVMLIKHDNFCFLLTYYKAYCAT